MPERFARVLHRALVSAAAVLAASLALGGAAHAASADAAEPSTPAACDVVGGDLSWGFKESFRAYISGSIAEGEWAVSGGATYETPNFGWSSATGTFDPGARAGDASFTGAIRFTGHDGLLDTTVADPTLRFAADGTAQLLVDLTTLSMDDALAGNAEAAETFTQLPLVTLDLAAAPLHVQGDAVTAAAVPTAITAEGFEAFGSYEPGTAFDPIALSLTLDCAEPSPTPEATPQPEPTEDAAVTTSAASGVEQVWLPWTLAGAALVAGAGVLTAWLVRRRRGVQGDRS